MSVAMKTSLMRVLRTGVPIVWMFVVQSLEANQWFIAAGPLLTGIGKYIREKHPDGSYSWIPF